MFSRPDTLDNLDGLFTRERTRLIRLCGQWVGDRYTAEDLAQETLLQAWRNRHTIHDSTSAGWSRWLSGIARNIYLRWLRERGRGQTCPIVADDEYEFGVHEEQLGDTYDLEIELEREELAILLDRALAQLSPLTRTILIERYIREAPHAEIAARLKISEDVVAQRIHRGKLSLRQVLTSQFREDAVSYGLISSTETGEEWQETRIWCTICGRAHLHASWKWQRTLLLMRCPVCNIHPDMYHFVFHDPDHQKFGDIKSFKSILSRVYKWTGEYIRPGMDVVSCLYCRKSVPVRIGPGYDLPPEFPPGGNNAHMYTLCTECRSVHHLRLPDYLLALPEGRRFWREHPRFRTLPEREIEIAGGPAVVTSFESMTDKARIDFVTARGMFEIIGIYEV